MLPLPNDTYIRCTAYLNDTPKTHFGIDVSDFEGLKFQKRMTQVQNKII